ncbi:MAG: phospholipid carrier-dependent glycosyltransferase [Deltaproteobacteria bacterium]|nr:phospholipid carrier-dependent glycosyltransferase [Deltaproteobacteria bacterium]MBI3294648.1 phospholipid carrier-dependent glycosyltransferase [Deltaproteobacteria bacterium]
MKHAVSVTHEPWTPRLIQSQPRSSRAICGILALSFFLHFWRLDVPRQVVFDEVHYGKFVNSYCCTHARFFDVHPPLPKLLIATTGRLAGMDGTFSFESIGLNYGSQPVFWLRFWPAVVGTLLPVVSYYLLLELAVSPATALLGALALTLENATLVETRYILLDGFLIFFILGAMLFSLKARRESLDWAALAGACAAAACLTKFTGLVTALCPIVFLFPLRKRSIQQLAAFLGTFIVIFLGTWLIHFRNQRLPGVGDAFIIPTHNFFHDLVAYHKEMYRANSTITTGHPDASRWWTWPILKTPPFYWTGSHRFIYLFGNVVLWWGSLVGMVLMVTHWLLGRLGRVKPLNLRPFGFAVLMYFAYYVPLWPIQRPLFMYHYLVAVWLAVIANVAWLEHLGWLPRYKRAFLITVGVGFVIALPLTYGWEVPHKYLTFLYWRPEFFLKN